MSSFWSKRRIADSTGFCKTCEDCYKPKQFLSGSHFTCKNITYQDLPHRTEMVKCVFHLFLNGGNHIPVKSQAQGHNKTSWIIGFLIHCLQQCKTELYLMLLGNRSVWMGSVDVTCGRTVLYPSRQSPRERSCEPAVHCKHCLKVTKDSYWCTSCCIYITSLVTEKVLPQI